MVLITGITGLVGSFVAKYFLGKGYQVAGLKRPNSDLSLLEEQAQAIHWFDGDILDVLALQKILADNGIDRVVHAAALVSFAPKDIDMMNKVNIEGTANVVNACLEASVKKLCFVSSIAALGRKIPHDYDKSQAIVIDEKSTWEEDPLNSNYAKSKYLAEMEVWRGLSEGLDIVIVNPSLILGEADWHKSSTQLFKYAFDEHRYYPNGTLNYVDAVDLAKCIYELTLSDISGERFVINAGPISYKTFFEKTATVFRKKAPSKLLSPWLAGVLWRLEAIRSFFTGKAPLLTKETALSSSHHFEYSNKKIKKAIAIEFQPFDTSIERICKNLAQKAQ